MKSRPTTNTNVTGMATRHWFQVFRIHYSYSDPLWEGFRNPHRYRFTYNLHPTAWDGWESNPPSVSSLTVKIPRVFGLITPESKS